MVDFLTNTIVPQLEERLGTKFAWGVGDEGEITGTSAVECLGRGEDFADVVGECLDMEPWMPSQKQQQQQQQQPFEQQAFEQKQFEHDPSEQQHHHEEDTNIKKGQRLETWLERMRTHAESVKKNETLERMNKELKGRTVSRDSVEEVIATVLDKHPQKVRSRYPPGQMEERDVTSQDESASPSVTSSMFEGLKEWMVENATSKQLEVRMKMTKKKCTKKRRKLSDRSNSSRRSRTSSSTDGRSDLEDSESNVRCDVDSSKKGDGGSVFVQTRRAYLPQMRAKFFQSLYPASMQAKIEYTNPQCIIATTPSPIIPTKGGKEQSPISEQRGRAKDPSNTTRKTTTIVRRKSSWKNLSSSVTTTSSNSGDANAKDTTHRDSSKIRRTIRRRSRSRTYNVHLDSKHHTKTPSPPPPQGATEMCGNVPIFQREGTFVKHQGRSLQLQETGLKVSRRKISSEKKKYSEVKAKVNSIRPRGKKVSETVDFINNNRSNRNKNNKNNNNNNNNDNNNNNNNRNNNNGRCVQNEWCKGGGDDANGGKEEKVGLKHTKNERKRFEKQINRLGLEIRKEHVQTIPRKPRADRKVEKNRAKIVEQEKRQRQRDEKMKKKKQQIEEKQRQQVLKIQEEQIRKQQKRREKREQQQQQKQQKELQKRQQKQQQERQKRQQQKQRQDRQAQKAASWRSNNYFVVKDMEKEVKTNSHDSLSTCSRVSRIDEIKIRLQRQQWKGIPTNREREITKEESKLKGIVQRLRPMFEEKFRQDLIQKRGGSGIASSSSAISQTSKKTKAPMGSSKSSFNDCSSSSKYFQPSNRVRRTSSTRRYQRTRKSSKNDLSNVQMAEQMKDVKVIAPKTYVRRHDSGALQQSPYLIPYMKSIQSAFDVFRKATHSKESSPSLVKEESSGVSLFEEESSSALKGQKATNIDVIGESDA